MRFRRAARDVVATTLGARNRALPPVNRRIEHARRAYREVAPVIPSGSNSTWSKKRKHKVLARFYRIWSATRKLVVGRLDQRPLDPTSKWR